METDPSSTSGPTPSPDPGEREVIEVEVERFSEGEGASGGRGGDQPPYRTHLKRLGAVGPVFFGVLLDLLDFVTVPPPVGLVVGLVMGFWGAAQLELKGGKALLLVAACGVYCALPVTNFVPIGTVYALAKGYQTWGQARS